MSKADSLREQVAMIAARRIDGKTWPQIAEELAQVGISVSSNEIRAWWPRLSRGLSPADVLLEASREAAPIKAMASDFLAMKDLLAKALDRADNFRADRDRLAAQIGNRSTVPPKMDSVEVKKARDELESARAEIDRLRKVLTTSKNELDFVKQQILRLKDFPETVIVHHMDIFPSSSNPLHDALDLVQTTARLVQWASGDAQEKPVENQPVQKPKSRGLDLSALDNFTPRIDLNLADDD